MSKASFYCTVNNLNGRHGSREIKRELDTIPGVFSVSVNEGTEKIAVDFDTTGVQSEEILNQIQKLGYEVVNTKLENHLM